MSGVRVLVGTRKGAFILTADGKRDRWNVSGPALRRLGGLPPQGIARRPRPALRLADQRLVRAGHPALRRRRQDVGAGRERRSPTTASPGTHQWYDGTPHPWEFKRVWHLEPSLTDPDTVYAGVEDAALFRSTDGGADVAGARRVCAATSRGARWQPGAGGLCLHTILLDPADPRSHLHRHLRRRRLPHRRRRHDAGSRSTAVCSSEYMPDPDADVGHCVHRIAMHASRPDVLFMQKHWDVMRSDDAGESWHEVSGNLPDRLRLHDRRARARAGHHLRRPDQERLRALPARGQAARLPQPDGRQRVGAADERACRSATAT